MARGQFSLLTNVICYNGNVIFNPTLGKNRSNHEIMSEVITTHSTKIQNDKERQLRNVQSLFF